MTTITITRAERDLILEEQWRFAPGLLDDPLPFGTREQAEDSISRLQLMLAVRDELGWDDDDLPVSFTWTMDERVVDALRSDAASWIDDRERQIEYRETHILGLRPTRYGTSWSDDYRTIEEANAAVDGQIAFAEEHQHAIEALIERIERQAVTA